jgi:hypothetical protein
MIDSTRPVANLWLGFALLESGDLVTAERELTKGARNGWRRMRGGATIIWPDLSRARRQGG